MLFSGSSPHPSPLLIGLFLFSTAASAEVGEGAEKQADYLSHFKPNQEKKLELAYQQMAHRDEFCQSVECEDRQLYHLRDGISIFVSKSQFTIRNRSALEDVVKNFAKFVNNATEGKLHLKDSPANIKIYIGDSEELQKAKLSVDPKGHEFFDKLEKAASGGCFAVITTGDSKIIGSTIFAPDTLHEEDVFSCIYEELYHSTGLFSDPFGKASLFDAFPPDTDFEYNPFSYETAWLLRRHYDTKLRAR